MIVPCISKLPIYPQDKTTLAEEVHEALMASIYLKQCAATELGRELDNDYAKCQKWQEVSSKSSRGYGDDTKLQNREKEPP